MVLGNQVQNEGPTVGVPRLECHRQSTRWRYRVRVQWTAVARSGTWQDRVVMALVAALFVGPTAILLFGEKPSRFGFQMYSGYGEVSATWEDASGAVHRVELSDHLANERGDVDWTVTLPEALCARIPEAVRVNVSRSHPGGDQRRSVLC